MQKYLQKSVGFAFHILMRSFSLVCLSSMASRCLFCSVRRSWFSLSSRISSSLRTMAVRTRCGNDKAIDIFTKLCVRRSLGNEIECKWMFQKLALWWNPFNPQDLWREKKPRNRIKVIPARSGTNLIFQLMGVPSYNEASNRGLWIVCLE